MVNPFKNIQLKYWPDYLLAITGVSFLVLLVGMISGRQIPGGIVYWVILFGGLVSFGIGAQIAHYRAHLKEIEGNINIWVSKWRHTILADSFAVIGVILVLYALGHFLGFYIDPNIVSTPG
ncbi:MAG: hypothetical protein MRK00_04485 [Nitrosomonas sp.]|nr:hypothetical protein [Nitrosomonas sp.]